MQPKKPIAYIPMDESRGFTRALGNRTAQRVEESEGTMTEERYKELMDQVGMPNSRSLLLALQQAVHETEAPLVAEIKTLREEIRRLKDVCTAAYFYGFNRGRDGAL